MIRNTFLFVVLLIIQNNFIAPSSFAQSFENELSVNEKLEQVKKNISTPNSKNMQEAQLKVNLQILNSIIEKMPRLAEAYYLRSLVQAKLSDEINATIDINKSIKLDPSYAKSYWQRGLLLASKNSISSALNDFDLSIKLGEKTAVMYSNRGALYQRLGKLDEALDDFNKAIALDSEQWFTYLMRANVLFALGKDKEALSDCDLLLKKRNLSKEFLADVLVTKASAEIASGRAKEAIVDLTKALESLSGRDKARAYCLRAAAFYKLSQKDQADKNIEEAKALGYEGLLTISSSKSQAVADKLLYAEGPEELQAMDKVMRPLVAEARKDLAKIKLRYLNGLPYGQSLLLTIRIFDKERNFEQIFVKVNSWKGDYIKGKISSKVRLADYKENDEIEISEKDILDWTIAKSDGTEEGNCIGKFLDRFH